MSKQSKLVSFKFWNHKFVTLKFKPRLSALISFISHLNVIMFKLKFLRKIELFISRGFFKPWFSFRQNYVTILLPNIASCYLCQVLLFLGLKPLVALFLDFSFSQRVALLSCFCVGFANKPLKLLSALLLSHVLCNYFDSQGMKHAAQLCS